jgi:hypothetical protein
MSTYQSRPLVRNGPGRAPSPVSIAVSFGMAWTIEAKQLMTSGAFVLRWVRAAVAGALVAAARTRGVHRCFPPLRLQRSGGPAINSGTFTRLRCRRSSTFHQLHRWTRPHCAWSFHFCSTCACCSDPIRYLADVAMRHLEPATWYSMPGREPWEHELTASCARLGDHAMCLAATWSLTCSFADRAAGT